MRKLPAHADESLWLVIEIKKEHNSLAYIRTTATFFDSQCSRDDVEGRSRELLSDRRQPTASVT